MHGQPTISILLADDHAGVRDAIRRLLARTPRLRVAAEATDGATAVRLAGELAPDLVILDVSMPGMGGIEAARLIVEATPSRVLMLSFQGEPHVVREALRAGARGYLLKEHAPRQLLRAIGTVLIGHRYVGHDITSPSDAGLEIGLTPEGRAGVGVGQRSGWRAS